ncbi:hypothetical protein KEM54_006471 [Ascosphaera aggregata]|nr:hypothetical protein KEM54_006471 [Ascosphaera aggregata]
MSLSASQSHAADLNNAHISPAQTASSSSPPPFAVSLNRTPVTVTATNSFPTPASSVCGRAANINSMDEGDELPETMDMIASRASPGYDDSNHHHYDRHQHHDNGLDKRIDGYINGRDPNFYHHDPHQVRQPTNHDRQDSSTRQSPKLAHGQSSGINSPAPFTPEFGKAFHLCKRNYQPVGPNVSIDLISLYGLGPVARTVGRNDLITGEKINRLRKSYEGKIKPLGLSGRNKPVRHMPGEPGGLLGLMALPEEEWQNQKVFGKDIRVPEPDSARHKLLLRATKCEPGPLPNAAYWEDLLGHEKGGKADRLGDHLRRSVSVVDGSRRDNNASPVSAFNSAAPSPSFPQSEYASNRPKRTGKKRSYQDNSFSGYGEGFIDDDADGDSAYDDESAKGKKRRRKV